MLDILLRDVGPISNSEGDDGDDNAVQKDILWYQVSGLDMEGCRLTVKTAMHTAVTMNSLDERALNRMGGLPRKGTHHRALSLLSSISLIFSSTSDTLADSQLQKTCVSAECGHRIEPLSDYRAT
jgi:hypothetical protein